MKGYFFSLEALIAGLLLMSSILYIHSEFPASSDKEEKIYLGMKMIEDERLISAMPDFEIERSLEDLLGFDISVNPEKINGPFIKYLVVEEGNRFRVIQIAYRQP